MTTIRLISLIAFLNLYLPSCISQSRYGKYLDLDTRVSFDIENACDAKSRKSRERFVVFEKGFNDKVTCIYNSKVVLDTFLVTNKTLGIVIKDLVIEQIPSKKDFFIYFGSTKQKCKIYISDRYSTLYINKYDKLLDLNYSNCDREYY